MEGRTRDGGETVMTRDAARELFAMALREVSPSTTSDLDDDLTLAELGVGSMDLVEIEMVMSDEGDLEFPEDAMSGVVTVGNVLDVVESLGSGGSREA
jgi:acyl carrier protein